VTPGSQSERYVRQLSVPALGPAARERLAEARVLVVGAGALGSPAAAYLAAAGVASIGLADDAEVTLDGVGDALFQLSPDVGANRAESVAAKLRFLNPEVQIDSYPARVGADNAEAILTGYDVALDCSGAESAHGLLSDACLALGLPLVIADSAGLEAWATVIDPAAGGCYRCFEPGPHTWLASERGAHGALGALGGIVGSIQALEAIKLIARAGEPLVGRLLVLDGLGMTAREEPLTAVPGCAACADARARVGAAA
jgi:molybdopterin/thiamine biosynthesis adenylyltransferase